MKAEKLIRHAVLPVAGFGTRMLPATKAVPKELLPILDRPALQYVMEEAVDAGIDDVLLVTSRHKKSIEQHFTRDRKLEARLKGRANLLRDLNRLISKFQLRTVDQPKQLGLGDAVLRAKNLIDAPFLCMLGDAVFTGDPSPARQLVSACVKLGTTIIGLEQVPREKVGQYGIVEGTPARHGVVRVESLIEKPKRGSTKSNLAIAARYILTPAIFDCIENTRSGTGKEVQLTDALNLLLKHEPIHGVILKSRRHDIGDPLGWLQANLVFAARDRKSWKQLRPTIESLLQ